MSTVLGAALAYAARGMAIFPCKPVSYGDAYKRPHTEHGFKDASTDPAVITAWWAQWPDALIGLPTGAWGWALDIDVKNGALGAESLADLISIHGPLPETSTVHTPSGGDHYLFNPIPELRSSAGKIAKGIDVRADGGYIIAAPSPGYSYKGSDENTKLADPPAWLVELALGKTADASRLNDKKPADVAFSEGSRNAGLTSPSGIICRARAYLAQMPPGISGEGGHTATYTAAVALVHGFCLSENEAMDLLAGDFNSRCIPSWSEAELRHKVRDAATKLHNLPRGWLQDAGSFSSAATAVFKDASVANPDEWPELIPFGQVDLPHVPVEAMGVLEPMVNEVARSSEVPPELPLGLALAVASGVAAHAYHVEMTAGYTEPLVVWVAACEKSGGRKSATKAVMCSPLYEWERTQAKKHEQGRAANDAQARMLQSKSKALIAQAEKEQDMVTAKQLSVSAASLESEAEVLRLPPPRLVTEDITVEHLGTMLERNHERLMMVSDEGGVFDSIAGRYKSKGSAPNIDLYLQAHAGASARVDRGSRPPVILHEPKLAMAVMPQPSVVAGLQAHDGFRGRGLLARFIWLLPTSRIGSRTFNQAPADPFVVTHYNDLIMRLINLPYPPEGEGTAAIHPSPEARLVWKDFVQANEQRLAPGGDLAHMTDWASKASGLVVRLAGILHACESANPVSDPIPASRVERAVALVKAFTAHALAAFDAMHADPDQEVAIAIWEVIQALPPQNRKLISAREVHRSLHSRYKTAEELAPGWARLVEFGYVRLAASEKHSGRPPIIYEVRPDFVTFVTGFQRGTSVGQGIEREEEISNDFIGHGDNSDETQSSGGHQRSSSGAAPVTVIDWPSSNPFSAVGVQL